MIDSALPKVFLRVFWRNLKRVGVNLLASFITLLGLLLITFILSHLSPVDPVMQLAGDHASASTYLHIRQQLGLDQPLLWQFWHYLTNLFQGNLGISQTTGQPVLEDLRQAFPATIELATAAMLLATSIGLLLAFLAVYRPGSLLDIFARFISLIGFSIPVFWLGLLGLLLFYAKLHWSPGPGQLDSLYEYTLADTTGFVLIDSWLSGQREIFFNAIAHLWLPVVVLATLAMASITRLLRVALLEESSKEYVLLARAKGVGRFSILIRHCLPNIRGTLVTVLFMVYASLLEGSVLTEIVFSWPGIGRYLTNALFSSDTPAILGTTLLIGTCYVLLNVLADVLSLSKADKAP